MMPVWIKDRNTCECLMPLTCQTGILIERLLDELQKKRQKWGIEETELIFVGIPPSLSVVDRSVAMALEGRYMAVGLQ